MRIIFKIARTELRNLFYSPVAWFLAIVFIIQCAIFYTYALVPIAKWQDIITRNHTKIRAEGQPLTMNIFLGPNGIIGNVLQNLYLFIPLLTMGVINREINNGSIKLLYSSPVKVRHIVGGKYLAIMIYNMLLVAIVGVFMITASFNIQHVDYGLLLSALLGFYLLVCTYTAIGLFMSSVTTYQVVSAIGTFIIIFILSRIGGLWQKYDYVRDLTTFLSIVGRTSKMMRGLITTKDIIYFLTIVYIFVGFTMIRLKGGRESKSWVVRAGRYVGVFVSALIIGYVTSLPALTIYWDTSARQINTLNPVTQKIVKDLGDEPLEVTLYTNLLGDGLRNGLPEGRNAYLATVWEKYLRFKTNINFKYEYYYDVKTGDSTFFKRFAPGKSLKEIAEQMADGYETKMSLFQSPAEIRKKINMDAENQRVVMKLSYKGRTAFARTFNDMDFWPYESQMAAALKRLENAKLPKVYFITGNLERSIYKSGEREFQGHSTEKLLRRSLVNLGFDADTVSLDTHDVPKDADILVLPDPKTELSTTTTDKIKQYVAGGGNMFILGEPGKQQMLNPLLKDMGVQLMPGNLVEPTEYEMPQMIMPYITPAAANLADEPKLLWLKSQLKNGGYEDTLQAIVPDATGIELEPNSPFKATPLMMTDSVKGWLKMGTLVTDSAKIEFQPNDGDKKGTFPVVVALTRNVNNKEQRIIVASDADFMSNLRGGGDFFGAAIYSYLDYNHYPVYGITQPPRDTRLNITSAGVTSEIIFFVWILPAIVLLIGVVILVRRKRK
jgi:ABC-2 type transport system permease protein